MGKKKEIKQAVPSVALITGAAAHELALKRADAEWQNTCAEADHAYLQAMQAAWSRYAAALRGFLATDKKAKTDGQAFNKQYDQDREQALQRYNSVCATADKKLQRILDAIDGDTEETTDE